MILSKKRYPFKKGNRTLNLHEVERLFLLSLVKLANPKTDLEKRILKRLIIKVLGHSTHWFPLYPPQECPICERTVSGMAFDSHVIKCKAKEKAERLQPKIDPDVWERLQRE